MLIDKINGFVFRNLSQFLNLFPQAKDFYIKKYLEYDIDLTLLSEKQFIEKLMQLKEIEDKTNEIQWNEHEIIKDYFKDTQQFYNLEFINDNFGDYHYEVNQFIFDTYQRRNEHD